jgi:glycosyltransferase involved in cell wall biosynthesis
VTKSILFVNHTGQLGGAEIMLLSIAQKYRDRCHVLLLSDGPFRQRLAALGVSVSVIDSNENMLKVSKLGGNLQALKAGPSVFAAVYRLAHAATSYDILYANSQKAAVITMLAGALLRKPVIWYLHDILSPEHFGKLQSQVVVTLANWTTRWVLTNSQASLDAFIACGGNKQRTSVVPCGIDSAPFDAVSDTKAISVRDALNLEGTHLVGLFGRITHWKGQHVLIRALPLLNDVHALIVGDALFGEQSYRDEVVELAKTLGVADRVHWLGFRQDIPQLMRAVDVILHTSVSPEPFGRVIVEGMMARRPVIATADGASREILGNEYKYMVKPADPSSLAEAILDALKTDPVVRNDLIESNYLRACSRFSQQQMIEQIDKTLERIQ